MKVNLNMDGVNQVSKDSVIYEKDEPLQSVCLILKGRVLVEADGIRTVFSSGNFLGACDIEMQVHSFTYTAYDNVVLYAFPLNSMEEFRAILAKKEEYRGLLNTSTNFFIGELNRTLKTLEEQCKNLREFVLSHYEFYQKLGLESGVLVDKISSVDILKKKRVGDISLCKEIDYYLECTKLPVAAQKNYFMGSSYISDFHYKQQIECVFSLLVGCRTYADQMKRCFGILVGDEKNLFTLCSRMALDMSHVGADNKRILLAIDELLEKINETETYLTEKAGVNVQLDRERMEGIYFSLISGESYEKKVESTEKKELQDLNNSLDQIMDYAQVGEEVRDKFVAAVKGFCRLSDKESKTPESDALRKVICTDFYRVYEAVFMKSLNDERPPLAVQLFLKYGYISENLLSSEKLDLLIEMKGRNELEGGAKVYSLSEWLLSIYKKENEPSKNEFDMDFNEFLRHEKATGFLNDAEYIKALEDPAERVHFEISNLVRYAGKVIFGRASVFVPILYEEGMTTPIEKALLTADRINSTLNKIQNVDYSIFYRERSVSYEQVKVSKEIIVKRCLPNIILFPLYGQNGIMWQDIVGKRRDTPGRFLFPILLEKDLQKEMLRILAHFRWEICRSEQGMQWNNLRYPSLTSEYTDYLQFYRKNSDLSPEAKTKVKAQLTQNNNRHREVFAKDYVDWITREANSAMKVNKVVRNILYTYVPFSATYREKLQEQTIYAEAGKRFRIEQAKRKKEIEASCVKFQRAGKELPPELALTKEYYGI